MKKIRHINSGETYPANEAHYVKYDGVYGHIVALGDSGKVGFFCNFGGDVEMEDVSDSFEVIDPESERLTNKTKVTVALEDLDMLRPATASDIIVGNVVYLIGDNNILHRKVISEVINPSSLYSGFTADDGCRYGLDTLYIHRTSNELRARVQELEAKLQQIKNISTL